MPPALTAYLNQSTVRKRLGAAPGVYWSACSAEVGKRLRADEMKDASPLLINLLDKYQYRVVLYNGQFDLNCGSIGTSLCHVSCHRRRYLHRCILSHSCTLY